MDDARVITMAYDDLVKDAHIPGNFSELMHLFALSAALQIAIQSYTPPTASVGCEQVRG